MAQGPLVHMRPNKKGVIILSGFLLYKRPTPWFHFAA